MQEMTGDREQQHAGSFTAISAKR